MFAFPLSVHVCGGWRRQATLPSVCFLFALFVVRSRWLNGRPARGGEHLGGLRIPNGGGVRIEGLSDMLSTSQAEFVDKFKN